MTMLYNIERNKWSRHPELKKARSHHSSCATNKAVYVMGGQSPSYLNSLERMALYEERDQDGNVKPREWELFEIPELT